MFLRDNFGKAIEGFWVLIFCFESFFFFFPCLSLSFKSALVINWASLVAQLVKNPPAMQQTWVGSLGGEDPLDKGKATHSNILA